MKILRFLFAGKSGLYRGIARLTQSSFCNDIGYESILMCAVYIPRLLISPEIIARLSRSKARENHGYFYLQGGKSSACPFPLWHFSKLVGAPMTNLVRCIILYFAAKLKRSWKNQLLHEYGSKEEWSDQEQWSKKGTAGSWLAFCKTNGYIHTKPYDKRMVARDGSETIDWGYVLIRHGNEPCKVWLT